MSEMLKPADEIITKNEARNDDVTNLLLNSKQWSFVQRQYNLTPREREIAELVCQGLHNDAIAKRLRLRLGTVKTHVRNIYRKVRVNNKISMLLTFVSDTRMLSCA